MVPTLAQFDMASFVSNHLSISMSHLLSQLKKDRDRPAIFIALGKVALAIRGNIGPYLDAVLLNIKEGLSLKVGKAKTSNEVSILECIRMLAAAVVCCRVLPIYV